MAASNPSIDQLRQVLGDAETRGLIQLYLEHTAGEIRRLAILPLDHQIMVVHALKGSSSQVGAKLFGAQCKAVEMSLRESGQLLTPNQIENLASEFALASVPFQAWLAESASPS